MEKQVLNKLEWDKIQQRLAGHCQSQQAKISALSLLPELTTGEILANWQVLTPLKDLWLKGERAPIGEIEQLGDLFIGLSKGKILSGPEFLGILRLLESVLRVLAFSRTHSSSCSPLGEVKDKLHPLPSLVKKIAQTIHVDGSINEQASPLLSQLLQQKQRIRGQIEQQLGQLLVNPDWHHYVQDDYFTLRSDRYVIPIKIDGRGRVAGSIIDTSESGQTLFVEPSSVRDLNHALQDVELSLKLEIIRIFKELTHQVAGDRSILEDNYRELIRVDFISAQAELAGEQSAHAIELVDEPLIDLVAARHPLLISSASGELSAKVVANDIHLSRQQPVVIISGPNAGGKTVVLKTISTLVCMMKAGLLVPAEPQSRLYNFRTIYLNLGDAQNLSSDLSTFSGHLTELKPIFYGASSLDLVCLDEIAVGTDPQTGAAIAQAILEHLADKKILSLVTTHFEGLKVLALQNSLFRNAAMEFSLTTRHPTYRLTLDVPGQSYGLEVARQVGLPAALIARADELRGNKVAELEQAFAQLHTEQAKLGEARRALEVETAKAETAKAHWQRERDLLQEARSQAAKKLQETYSRELAERRQEFDEMMKNLRQSEKALLSTSISPQLTEEGDKIKATMQGMKQTLARLDQQYRVKEDLPGTVVEVTSLQVGDAVYVVPLGKNALVHKGAKTSQEKVEVKLGAMKFLVTGENLRKLSGDSARKTKQQGKSPASGRIQGERDSFSGSAGGGGASFLSAQINTLDLRGVEVLPALEQLWKFIDAAVMRGEGSILVIHGHGHGNLKAGIREALALEKNYRLSFGPGGKDEGGDGVTIVTLGEE